MKIDFSKATKKFLDDLPPKQFRQIVNKILALADNPHPQDSKTLTGSSYLRADIGEYRIIYLVQGDTLLVHLVGKRNDGEVYRNLK